MAVVHIDNLVPDMVLRRDVNDRSGRLLLPAGNALTEKHLKIFRTWGIVEADIEGDESSEAPPPLVSEELDPLLAAAAEEAVTQLFSRNDPHHPAIRELMQLCIKRKVTHAS
jgi:hypothetical protein